MGYKFCKPYKGYCCGQFLRSFNEFIVAVSLELVDKCIWRTESIIFEDCNGRKKIPDFVIYDENWNIVRIIEVKNNDQEAEDVLVDYATRRLSIDNCRYDFIGMTTPRKRYWIEKITNVIGKEEWERLSKLYKSQIDKNTGFLGESNPMFGKKHSAETIAKIIANTPKNIREKNGMFGKKHSKEAKKQNGARMVRSRNQSKFAEKRIYKALFEP